jgi:hypothetical protein
MNDEYLWDKSGEPDPEIQQLEEVLGSLKYQPRPLEIPRDLVMVRPRRYSPYLAIAASLIFALLVAGLWLLRVQDQNERPASEAKVQQPKPAPPNTIDREDKHPIAVKKEPIVAVNGPVRHKSPNVRNLNTKLTRREREEALAVKQQLLLALRLASEKLNLAQKKTVNPSAPTQIRNQHKVG